MSCGCVEDGVCVSCGCVDDGVCVSCGCVEDVCELWVCGG